MKVGERVAVTVGATAHAKKVAVSIAKVVMAPGPSPVMQPVKAVAMGAVADAVAAAVVVVPGGTAQIVQRQARVKGRASASDLMQKANPSRWMLLPHLG